MKILHLVFIALIFAVSLHGAESTALDIQPDRASGVYRVGETVTWTVSQTDGSSILPAELNYVFKAGGATEVEAGSITLVEDQAMLISEFTEPNTMLLEVSWEHAGEKQRVLGGAVAAPEQLKPSVEVPDDFDEFWAAKIAELGTTPMNPRLTPMEVDKEGVEYWQITMDGFRGSQIHGQIARPKNGSPQLPALLRVQWAGVYGLKKEWVTGRARAGWLALNILAHDLPIDEPPGFYTGQQAGPLKDYTRQGNEDRETSYFLRMYLSCYRAVEYLKTRTDWDGKTIVVTGTSQGGQQTFVTAGLHPDITAAMALVPAGADFNGNENGRAVGFPYWPGNLGDKDADAVAATGGYFDIVNFASRIRAPMLIGVGLEDLSCPPAGVFTAINQLQSHHETVILPDSGHHNVDGSHQPFDERMEKDWLPALQVGLEPPTDTR